MQDFPKRFRTDKRRKAENANPRLSLYPLPKPVILLRRVFAIKSALR